MNDLLEMELHDVITINEFIKILRVYNGWVYLIRTDDNITSTFVPYE